ncbi:MAG: hypothetical protein AAGA42_19160 [Actinomycetota bacterium]
MDFFVQLAVTAAFVLGINIVIGLCALFVVLPDPRNADAELMAADLGEGADVRDPLVTESATPELVDATGWYREI